MIVKRAALCAGVTVLGLVGVTACGGGSSTSSSSKGGKSIAIGLPFATVNFNPWLSPNGSNYTLNYTSAVYDSLTTLSGPDKIVPASPRAGPSPPRRPCSSPCAAGSRSATARRWTPPR